MKASGAVMRRLLTMVTFLMGLAVAAVILEGGVRVMMPQEDIAEWFRKDAELGFTLKPNYSQAYHYSGHDFTMNVRTNSRGFRDKETDWSLPCEGKRVVFLGDSYVFGYGIQVEDRVDTRFEELCAGGGDPVQTINCGTPGWGTRQETAFALKHLETLDPDVIALFFCENDPENDEGRLAPALSNEESLLFWPKLLLRRHSHTYRLFLKQKFLFQYRQQVAAGADSSPPTQPGDWEAGVISEEQWQNTLAIITSFHEAFLEHNPNGVLLVVATSPANEDIRKNLSKLNAMPRLHYLDLAERYSKLSLDDRRCPWDDHWSPQVHQLAAEELYAWLSRHRWSAP